MMNRRKPEVRFVYGHIGRDTQGRGSEQDKSWGTELEKEHNEYLCTYVNKLALHIADQGFKPQYPYGPPRVNPELRDRNKP